MTIRPKTTRRVSILLFGLILIGGTGFGVYKLGMRVRERKLTASMLAGMQAYNAGDYLTARTELNTYASQHKDNPKVLLAFANTLAKTASPDNKDAATAIFWMGKYVGLQPGDRVAQHQLLQMEVAASDKVADAQDLANDLLSKDPGDLVALKALLTIDVRDAKWADALGWADKYVALDQTDLDVQSVDFMLLKQLGRPGTEITGRADALAKKYPDDPRFLILRALGAFYGEAPGADRATHMHDLAVQAAAAVPPDIQFVKMTVSFLDNTAEFGKSEDLLARGVDAFHDAGLMSELVRRLWEHHEYDDVVGRLSGLDAATGDVNLVAYKGLSLASMGQMKDAGPLADALVKRGADGDKRAVAWGAILKARTGDGSGDVRTLLPVLQTALLDDPRNAAIEFMIGTVYMHIGEEDLALQSFRSARDDSKTWSDPYIRIGQILSRKNQADTHEALQSAAMGVATSQMPGNVTSVEALVAQWEIQCAVLKKHPNPASQAAILANVENLQKQHPGESGSLPIYVDLLAQAGRRDEAIAAARSATKRKPGGETTELLARLAMVSEQDGLGLEDEIFAVQQEGGMTPMLAMERAAQLALHGQNAQGLKLLQDARAAANPRDDAAAAWDIQICQYLEQTRDDTAGAEWRKTGDAWPNELTVQATILSEPSNPGLADRDFADRTIKRLRALTGDQATQWKVSRARWLLTGPTAAADAPAALALLDEVIKVSPSEYLPHVLSAGAYEKEKNLDAAVEQWRAAADLEPASAVPVMAQVRDLHAEGKLDEARTEFDRMMGMDLPFAISVEAANVMAAQGDLQRARSMLEHVTGPGPNDPKPDVADTVRHDAILAKILSLQGQNDDAAKIYLNLQKSGEENPAVMKEAADFFASIGRTDMAKSFLDQLVNATPDATRRALGAEYDEQFNVGSAAQDYADAVKASGDDPTGTVAQIGYLIRQKKYADARDAATAAQSRWGDSDPLSVLRSTADLMANAKNADDLAPLAGAVSANPVQGPALDALRISASADPDAANKLETLAKQDPPVELVYEVASQALMSANRVDEGLGLAENARQLFPNSAESARVAANAYIQLGRWNEALSAAQDWRTRSAAQPRNADLTIASIEEHLGRAHDAADLLTPYAAVAEADPDHNSVFLLTYAQALIGSGQSDDAANLLRPLAEKSPVWRGIWLLAASAQTDGDSAAAWIAGCPGLDTNSLQDMGNEAFAYFEAAGRLSYPMGYQKACDALQPFMGSDKIPVNALMLYGNAASKANHAADAEKAYRKVLALQPDPTAMNNLADFLRQKGDPASLAEAETLSRKAVADAPQDPTAASYYDTLARILRLEGKADDAIAQFEKGHQANPRNLSILSGLADAYAMNARIDDATRILQELDAIPSAPTRMTRDEQAEVDSARTKVADASGAATHGSTTGN